MPTILALIMEGILVLNLFRLMKKLKKKGLETEYNIALSSLALVGIVIVITVVLRMVSGF